MNKMTLGQRMKFYEKRETERTFFPMLPVYARIDGRSFHTFTRGMNRPYDELLSLAMIETTKYLVEHTNAKVGYTQSDEISLVFYSDRFDSQIFFGGSVFKMTSNLASIATAKFIQIGLELFPNNIRRMLPTFDCRVIQLPSKEECVNMIVWRVRDAIKNSVSMVAVNEYGHKFLVGKNTRDKLDLLHARGINWNDYPQFFKEGSFIKRVLITRSLSDDELDRIPNQYRPKEPVTRSRVVQMELPPFEQILNKVGFVFDDQVPIIIGGIDNGSKYNFVE